MKEKFKVLVVIPAYNEAQNIQKVFDELKRDLPYADVLVINDCSKDNTKEIVEKNGIKCITTVFNFRYARAVQTGIKYAYKNGYDYVIQLDGDGQHIPKEADKLVKRMKETNADIVIGSRYLEKGNYNAPFFRKIGTGFFSFLIKLACRQKISDPLSGFQVLNRRVIEKYSKIGEYPEYPDANLVIDMIMQGYKVEEVSIKMRNREFGESMHGGIIKPIKYMLLMFYNVLVIMLNNIGRRRKK
ncbi:MAG: glycosyltransferase family 2 protein [Clostridia bacterium]|nr:glycosyltransferase family 2 protein [Clostridia bacterium]